MSSQVFRPGEVSIGLDYIEFDARLGRDGECKPVVKAGYMALATFANVEDHTTLSPEATAGFSEEARRALLPYRSSIAARIGRSVDTVDKANRELVERELLLIAPQPSGDGSLDANVYHLTDREQWARRTLERAEARTAALAAGEPWPPRQPGPYVPRVYRDPGFDFIKLDAPTVASGEKSPNFKAVYAAVATFVHGKTRISSNRPPTYKELCACTGLGRSTVAANVSEMADDGLLLITERYDEENGGRLASEYTLMDGKWWAQRALARMREAEEEHARENDLVGGVAASAGRGWPRQLDGGGRVSWTGVAASAGPHYKKGSRSEQDDGADAVGNGAGGYARAGVCKSAAAESAGAAGGSAASDKTLPPQRMKPSSPKPATVKTRPRQEAPGFAEARAAIPEAVARQGTRLYPGLHRAINDLLMGAEGIPSRTPEQVIARIGRRWFGEKADTRSAADYRGCDRCTASGCKAARRSAEAPDGCDRIINRSSWLATALLVQDCPDPSCEDGIMLDGTGECRACIKRGEDRRRDEEAAAEAAARYALGDPAPPDAASRAAAMATTEGWLQAAETEEARFRLLLTARGMYGSMLDHQVIEHMTGWQDRHPAPFGPAALHTTPFGVRIEAPPESGYGQAEEEPDYDGPVEEEQARDLAAWDTALRNPEWQAWKAEQAAARERRTAERLGALTGR
ncbi:hypothetical protein [Streptomyces sp. NPDC002044]|uniref:hypothetical protein n=1 Tax=Streptomyces sp. NPDC002044 TaxID=3154662 RepID=UPI00332F8BD6